MKTIMISPTNKASQRTKNRIREHGPKFQTSWRHDHAWLLSSGEWFGWLPRDEFHVECVGEKFIEKVLDR
jgi:hypothetical protein